MAKSGRKKSKKFLSYEVAKQFVQDNGIESRADYYRWHKLYQIKNIPPFPYRVYKEWKGWCDFLNSNKSFAKEWHGYKRSWEEHLLYARNSGIKSMGEWIATKHPSDISRRPDSHFKQFTGWHYFLGLGKKKVANLVEVTQKIEDNLVEILLFSIEDQVQGTVRVDIFRGLETTKQFIREKQIKIIKAFKLDKGYDWKSYLKKWGVDYGNGEWRIENLNECLFNIDLEWLR